MKNISLGDLLQILATGDAENIANLVEQFQSGSLTIENTSVVDLDL